MRGEAERRRTVHGAGNGAMMEQGRAEERQRSSGGAWAGAQAVAGTTNDDGAGAPGDYAPAQAPQMSNDGLPWLDNGAQS